MIMTMSGDHTETSSPLDLTTKQRQITDQTKTQQRADRTRSLEIADRTRSLEIADRAPDAGAEERTSRLFHTVRTDSEEHKDDENRSTETIPSDLKSVRTPKGKPETATSKLPIRKRPFRPAQPSPEQSDNDADIHLEKVLKTTSSASPSPAKIPKCASVRNGLNAEAHRLLHSPNPGGSHGVCDIAHVMPTYYTYYPSPLPSFEDTNRLLTEVALATHQDEDGDTALHIAVAQEKEAVVHWLIRVLCQAQRNLDLYNNLRQTPLHLAIITHQPGVVEALLLGGADPRALDRNGQTALHLCCEHRQEMCLTIILSHLSRSACCLSDCLDCRNYEGLAPLHMAVQNGNKKMAKMLLDSGADINAVDIKSGRSPLIHAVENSCMEMVNFLIERGCNVNAQSYSGNTALHIASGRGEVEAVRILLKNGADSSLKNYHNDTAVMVSKNKKVSDVLRGKAPRGHILKTQHSINGASSPVSLNRSPAGTPNPQHSASVSPTAIHIYSPHSQSGESRSGNLSPVEALETDIFPRTVNDTVADKSADYIVSLHPFPFFQAPCSHMHMEALMPVHPSYYPTIVQRPFYPTDKPVLLIPARNGQPVSHRSPSQPTVIQSRPSSHESDQSDISNKSASSEGKGIS